MQRCRGISFFLSYVNSHDIKQTTKSHTFTGAGVAKPSCRDFLTTLEVSLSAYGSVMACAGRAAALYSCFYVVRHAIKFTTNIFYLFMQHESLLARALWSSCLLVDLHVFVLVLLYSRFGLGDDYPLRVKRTGHARH